jgi:ornithine cyclodeaminase/alanine dehydrogenase-like protein (mu-crystallin family)
LALFIREEEVRQLLTMEDTLEAVEEVFRQQADGMAVNRLRSRIHIGGKGSLNLAAGAAFHRQAMGLKVYTAYRSGTRFMVLLYSTETGELLAVVEADLLGRMRTGATSGVATKYLARRDAATVGIIGTGGQAVTQLAAVCAVRRISKVRAFSRKPEGREDFCKRMSKALEIEVVPAESAQMAVEGADIVVTITSSRDPVVNGEWIQAGTHINAAGSNDLTRREIDNALVRRCDVIVVDSREQARVECGDLLQAVERGVVQWEGIRELGEVVAGRVPGRSSDDDITLFASQGLAIEDVATASRLLELAKAQGLGESIPL